MAKKKKAYGPQHPLARRYVLEFGTCMFSFIYLEEQLREYVIKQKIVAAKWPLQPKKLEKVLDSLEKAMLPDLIALFAAFEPHSNLSGELKALVPKRNTLTHNILPVFDPTTFELLKSRITEHSQRFRRITAQVHAALVAIQAADEAVLEQIVARHKKEPSANHTDLAALAALLNRNTGKTISTLDS